MNPFQAEIWDPGLLDDAYSHHPSSTPPPSSGTSHATPPSSSTTTVSTTGTGVTGSKLLDSHPTQQQLDKRTPSSGLAAEWVSSSNASTSSLDSDDDPSSQQHPQQSSPALSITSSLSKLGRKTSRKLSFNKDAFGFHSSSNYGNGQKK